MTNKMINQGLLMALMAIALSCNKSSVISESEKQWLKNHPDLNIGISPNQPPYQFISEKGEIKGMFIDFLTDIEDRLDYKFKKIYQPDWTKLLSDAKNGTIDIVLEIQETDERKEYLKFTPFLISHKHVFITKNTRDDIASVNDLHDKKVAVVHSFAVFDYLLKNYPDFSILPLFDNITGLRAVSTGQVDAFVAQQAVATYYIETEGFSNLKIAGEIDYPNELAIASRKDLDTLHIILSKAVNAITITEKQTIYNRWLSYEVKPFYAEVKFWIVILVVISLALTFVILFNLVLRKRVKEKTSELKVAKEKAEENYALLRIAGEKAKLGGWNVNLKDFRSYWSDVVAAIHEMPPGYSPLVEDGINFYAPEWREKIKKVFTECAQHGIPYDEEMEIITSTGKRVWVRTIGEAVRNEEGEIFKVEGAFQDITENKRADEAIRKAHDQLTKIILTSPNIICSAHLQSDGTLNFPFGGERLAEYYGIPEANLARDSSPYQALIHPDDNENVYASILESAKQLSPWRCEYRMVHPVKGVLWIEGHSMPNRETDGSTLWYGVVTDITDRKRTEDKVIASQVELNKALQESNQSRQLLLSVLEDQQNAQKKLNQLNIELEQRVAERTALLEASNKELEAFSYSVSHDLRAPLRHINGYVDLLNSRLKDELPEKAHHYLKTISEASSQMGILIDELLKYSRTGQKEMRKSELNFNALLKEILEEMKTDTMGRNITWNIQDLPKVYGDYTLLKLVWINLLDNAIKYTRNQQTAKISVGYKKEANEFIFWVCDNGVGFDMKYAHKLFGVFQRLHSQTEFEGTGIGLANVQRIIHKHLGRVWAEAEPGKGAKFYFSLPIYK